jgi:ribonuclease P protein component
VLPRAQRLSRSPDVRAVLRRGRRRAGDLVVVHVRRRDDDGPGRVTAVATRRVGGAVERNRAKRVLRAAAAEVGVADGVDVALVARPATVASTSGAVADELRALHDGRRIGAVEVTA